MSGERPGWHRHPNGGGWVEDTAHVADTAYVGPDAEVYGSAWVSGWAQVYGSSEVYGSAWVSETRHILTVGPIGSENQMITLARTADGHTLTIGCWQEHTIDELAEEVQRRCPQHADEYAAAEALLRLRIAEWEAQR